MRLVVFLCVVLGWASVVTAARTVYSEGLITIKLELGQPTAMVFPEEISTLTTAMPKERLQISTDAAYAGFVLVDPELPRNRQIVTGISGRVYLVYVEVAKAGQAGDDLVYVTHKAPVQAEQLTPLSVLRTLRSAKGPGPAQPTTLPLPAPQDPRIVLTTPQQYTVGPYQALVLTVENTQDLPLALDERVGQEGTDIPQTVRLTTWAWPPGRLLKAVAVEQPLLAPHGATTLYLVFEGGK